MIWLIFQSSIIFAVVASNIHWHWTPNEARQIASISLRQNHAGLKATGCRHHRRQDRQTHEAASRLN
jgi:hypothetical protein